jgi:hypothetical protein
MGSEIHPMMWQPDREEPNGGVGDAVLGLRGATKTFGGTAALLSMELRL